jgi:hypothetical protein
MRRWIWAVCAIAACAPKEAAMKGSADDIRGDVLALVQPFAGRADYAVTDPSFVDPVIADTIKQLGERASRDQVVQAAATFVSSKLSQPEGRARLTKLVADRYAHPVITRDGNRVTIDVGVVAAPIGVYRAQLVVDSSPNVDRGEWATAEVVRNLKLAMARFPDASSYEAVVLIPQRSHRPEWRYSYDRDRDQLRVVPPDSPNTVYVSEKLGGDLANLRSAHSSALR